MVSYIKILLQNPNSFYDRNFYLNSFLPYYDILFALNLKYIFNLLRISCQAKVLLTTVSIFLIFVFISFSILQSFLWDCCHHLRSLGLDGLYLINLRNLITQKVSFCWKPIGLKDCSLSFSVLFLMVNFAFSLIYYISSNAVTFHQFHLLVWSYWCC